MTLRIRDARAQDRAEWLRMLVALYDGTSAADHVPDIDGFLGGQPSGNPPHAAVFVGEREGEAGLAGLLELSIRDYAEGCAGPVPYVESWYVDADVRGRGVGRALMAAAAGWARDRGYRELASDTQLENRASFDAHRRLGFEEVERAIHLRKPL